MFLSFLNLVKSLAYPLDLPGGYLDSQMLLSKLSSFHSFTSNVYCLLVVLLVTFCCRLADQIKESEWLIDSAHLQYQETTELFNLNKTKYNKENDKESLYFLNAWHWACPCIWRS